MTEQQTTYATSKTKAPPTEPTGYTAIGRAVFALYGDDVSVLICECHSPRPAWRGLTYNQACEMAERIAKMMNGQLL